MIPTQPAEAATLTGPVTGGRTIAPVSPLPVDLAAHGYVEEEFFASGAATSYSSDAPPRVDGRWDVAAKDRAEYRTRIVVRRPLDSTRFSGTVLVEWCNVSGGMEAAADWAYLHPEILRAGHAYVAVSAQALGVHGGGGLLDVPGRRPDSGLVTRAPERYGSLRHPGDQFAFDLFSQVSAALGRPGPVSPFGDLRPQRLLAIGESQSAIFLATYIDAVHLTDSVFDAFFVHSRGGSGASLEGRVLDELAVPGPLRIRGDLDVPVLQLATETDVGPLLDFSPARQPDTAHVRTWEVAGTSHADAYLIGPLAAALGWTEPVNDGPHHYVAQAALDALVRWAADGTPPPSAPPLQLSCASPPAIARDDLGNAIGGVRTPDVDAPVAALSGEGPAGADTMRALFGTTTPFDRPTLRALYGDRAGYLARYQQRLAETIDAGFLLDSDREELLARAERVEFPG
jgi:hypothetical protein